MTIDKSFENGVNTLKIGGRLDTVTAPDLEKMLDTLESKNLIFDFSDLEYVSSAGLRVILKAQKNMTDGMKIVNANEDIKEVFEMTGFTNILTIE